MPTSGGGGMMSRVVRAGRSFAARFRSRPKRSSATRAFDAVAPAEAASCKDGCAMAAAPGAQALLPNVPLTEENTIATNFTTAAGSACRKCERWQEHGSQDDDNTSLWSVLSPSEGSSSLCISMGSEQVEHDDIEQLSVGDVFAGSECPGVATHEVEVACTCRESQRSAARGAAAPLE